MSENQKKPKQLLEPFLRKMAIRDEAIIESKAHPNNKKGKKVPSTTRQGSVQLNKLYIRNNSVQPTTTGTSSSNAPDQLQIEVQTTVEHEIQKPNEANTKPSTAIISIRSETSVRSSFSSISIKSTIKTTYNMEDSPSFYQKLVVPFSGFTEDDIKEIRGGKEPKLRQSSMMYPGMSGNVNEPRPVLRKYQSEKRKSSYDRYVKESFEQFIPTRNNTEDSSYNTVIAVKMMVEDNAKLRELISNAIIAEEEANNSKDTIYFPNSEMLGSDLDQQLKHDSLENSLQENTADTPVPTQKSDGTYKRLMDLRKELEELDLENERMQEEYDDAEKAYFTAKLNYHRMKMRRERLISKLNQLEDDINKKQ